MEESKEIKEAIETLEDISSDEAKERIAELREKYIMDKEVELETAEEKGLKKGLEQGIEQGENKRNIEIAKKMLQKSIEIETIIEITGLTQEEIEKINRKD